jgi:MHS family proline/betaine transporter-like MFS transporter
MVFPNRALATGLGLSDNLAGSIFDGTAAVTITWLIALTGSNLIPAYYVIAGDIVGLLGTLRYADSVCGRAFADFVGFASG